MIMVVLALVVLSQIVLFQFIAALANRSVLRSEAAQVTGTIPPTVVRHSQVAPVVRMGIGGVLVVGTLLALLLPDERQSFAVIAIVGASAVSGIIFAVGQATDRRVMRHLAEAVEGGGVRRASIARRTLDKWYHPALEAIPVTIMIATAVFLLSTNGFTMGSDVLNERPRILVYLGLQGAFVIGGLYRAFRPVVGIASIAQYLPSLRRDPISSVRLGEELAGTQLRFFLVAKVGLSALLGVQVVKNVLRATGGVAAGPWVAAGWFILAALFVAYVFYLRKIGEITRRMQEQADPASC